MTRISQEVTERFYSLLAVRRGLQGERMRRIGVLTSFASDDPSSTSA